MTKYISIIYASLNNASGQVVGTSYNWNPDVERAFLYSGGTMTDLNSLIDPSSGWTLTEATAINDKGQIVGSGTNAARQVHAFLLSPLPATVTVLPNTTTAYGSLLVGNTAVRTFYVTNVGTSTISVTVSVSPPFSVVGSGSYTLAPGQFTNTTIRYAPVSAGNNTAYVTFTGGGIQTRQVTGSAYFDPTPTTGTIVGQVTRVSGGTPVNKVTVSVTGPDGALYPQALTGSGGSFSVSGLRAGTQYSVTAIPPDGLLLGSVTANGVTVVAGQTNTVNIALPSVTGPPAATTENTPVVLVRGYGPVRPWADDDSKSWSLIRSALESDGFANVWDCNQPEADIMGGTGNAIIGTNGIAYNAYRLKYYLWQKSEKYKSVRGYYPPKIHIVAHSMGGLIVRAALGDYDQFTFWAGSPPLKVGKVVMLATPHCGSPVADDIASPLSRLGRETLGRADPCYDLYKDIENWGSMHDLTTSWMRNYNLNGRWPGLPLYIVWASRAGDWWPLKSWNSCIDWSPLGKLVIGPWNKRHQVNNTEEDWHDGAVTKPSANGVYWTRVHWTYDSCWPVYSPPYPVTSVALQPVQSVSDSDLGTPVDHLFILQQSGVTNWIVKTLLNPDPTPTPLAAGPSAMTENAQSLNAGAETQQVVQVFESLDGTVTNGAVISLPVASDALTTLTFELVATDTNIALRLNDPFGAVIDANTPLKNTNVQYTASTVMGNLLMATFTIASPTAGVWTTVIDASSITTTQAVYSLMVYGDSNVGLIPQTASLFGQGQDTVLSCGLADLSTNPVVAVSNASITATVRLPDGATNNFTLFDDGWHNDSAPNDGIYAAVMTNVQQAGTYSIAYRAYGTNAQGQALQRVAAGSFSVSTGNGTILGDPIYETVDTDGDGYADFLIVKVWVNPTAAGSYILSGQLVDTMGLHNFARTAQFSADGTGPMQVTLIFDLAEMRAAGGSGDFHIENLQLFEVTGSGTAWLDAYQGSSVVYIQAPTKAINIGVRTNQFGFTITGTSNLVIVVEACTNLANPVWSPVGTNTLTGGSSYFSDSQWTNSPGRFYRLRSP